MTALREKIRQTALDLGFDLVGFTSADRLPRQEEALRKWLADGYAAEMAYMAREPARRADPGLSLDGARSLICLALNYYPGEFPPKSGNQGKISRYAWGEDYHGVIEEMLDRLETAIRRHAGQPIRIKRYVDYGPILERAYASRAGLGFIGKNTMLITHEFGSWVFLAELITDLDLGSDTPPESQRDVVSECGTCSLCIEACPTGAISGPFRLDANRCISYLTIENKKEIPESFRHQMQEWVFGCDICQEVCPYNYRAQISPHPAFLRGTGPWVDAEEIQDMDPETFAIRFQNTPLLRPKHRGLQRNVKTVLRS